MFWIVARTCFALYRTFPLFGMLRASIGILQREDKFLVIERADGLGLCLPGGASSWRETEKSTLHREFREETGLVVTCEKLQLTYESRSELPCTVSAYEVHASGEPKGSWEGAVQWTTLEELESRILAGQRPILEILRRLSSTHK